TILPACATGPCIDPIFGPTQAADYWSLTTDPIVPGNAQVGRFNDGSVGSDSKALFLYTRAVRVHNVSARLATNGTRLNATRLEGSPLVTGVRLDGTRRDGMRLTGTRLDGTLFTGARADGTALAGTDFIGAMFVAELSDGATLPLRIDDMVRGGPP